jgi:glycerol-1-phosphate dehydrogenase [NAD(P)+]
MVYGLPTIHYKNLSEWEEERPAALITSEQDWNQVKEDLHLPLVVQAEPGQTDYAFLKNLAENVPGMVEVVYAVGGSKQAAAGKVVAYENDLPLVIVPTALDSDQLFEPHVELLEDGIINVVETRPAESLIVDWDVIRAAEPERRAAMVGDMLAIVTGLLDWRYAGKKEKNADGQKFIPWAAGIAAGIASQTIKLAEKIGQGDIESLRGLMDLTAVSVQLANQLGHSRHQEGTEHYLAFSMENQLGSGFYHADYLAPGIVLTSALHGQDPSALRDALEAAQIPIKKVRQADLQLAINDLPTFVAANNLPYAIAHDLDPFGDELLAALDKAGLSGDTGGWEISQEAEAADEDDAELEPEAD